MKNLAPHTDSKDPTLSRVKEEEQARKESALHYLHYGFSKAGRTSIELLVEFRMALDNPTQPAQN
jgi:hypothetical protein